MTTLAKIEANRRNAELSTGPRTAEGMAVVARNATTHGIYSNIPVIPGEDPAVWEAHRAGVVASLTPVGLLEVNLAERAALLLWRLGRVARYEAESVAAAMEAAEVPPLPPPPDTTPELFRKPPQKTREEQLCDLRNELRIARRELAEVTPARDFFSLDEEAEQETVVPFEVAATVLEFALGCAETAENLRGDTPRFDSKAFLKKLDLPGADVGKVTWTANLIRRGLLIYADYAQEPTERFVEAVRSDLESWAEELTRTVRRLERETTAVARLLDGRTARKRAAQLLPGDGRDARIAKYERHLHSLLTSTLHELDRLQARRAGEGFTAPGGRPEHDGRDPHRLNGAVALFW